MNWGDWGLRDDDCEGGCHGDDDDGSCERVFMVMMRIVFVIVFKVMRRRTKMVGMVFPRWLSLWLLRR